MWAFVIWHLLLLISDFATCNNMDGLGGYAKWNMLNRKRRILYDVEYEK